MNIALYRKNEDELKFEYVQNEQHLTASFLSSILQLLPRVTPRGFHTGTRDRHQGFPLEGRPQEKLKVRCSLWFPTSMYAGLQLVYNSGHPQPSQPTLLPNSVRWHRGRRQGRKDILTEELNQNYQLDLLYQKRHNRGGPSSPLFTELKCML